MEEQPLPLDNRVVLFIRYHYGIFQEKFHLLFGPFPDLFWGFLGEFSLFGRPGEGSGEEKNPQAKEKKAFHTQRAERHPEKEEGFRR